MGEKYAAVAVWIEETNDLKKVFVIRDGEGATAWMEQRGTCVVAASRGDGHARHGQLNWSIAIPTGCPVTSRRFSLEISKEGSDAISIRLH